MPAIALAGIAAPAYAQERPLPAVSQGYDGANGKAYLLFIPNEHAEEGGQGGDVRLQDVDVSGIDPSTTIKIGSVGGKGGRGDDSGGSHEFGARGGFAGTVDVGVAQTLIGRGDQISVDGTARQNSPAPRLWIYARGGNGGDAQHNVGGGGGGGPAAATLSGLLTTDGIGFQGVRVSAIGGNAGNGGTDEDETFYRQGGFGGTVGLNLTPTAKVTTSGEAATAAVVESLGGAGSVRGRGTFYSLPEVTRGGDGGAVYLTNAGQIATTGHYAIGALAQSVGGLGGQASLDGGGRDGAAGGVGGDVSVASPGLIDTAGDYAFGLVAQSVGGNGGRGGLGNFGGGGRGGDASAGGRVVVDHAGTIRTRGEGATAIVAQSVSGGGAFAAFRADPNATTGAGGVGGATGFFSFGAGGGGGSGSTGGEASVTHGGTIETSGAKAYGILAQSIGGGGGGGGSSEAYGIFYTVAAGGNGGTGGAGGLANVTTLDGARITTVGEDAAALLVQSIGGGGGIGGSATAITVGSIISEATAIGGIGGSGGTAGDAWVHNAATLTTGGARAYGVQAMSIGGGGGTGGSSFAKTFSLSADPEFPTIAIATAVGGRGGVGATSGNVDVANNGAIATTGGDAAAILAMSVGGGGGTGGIADVYNLAVNLKDTLTLTLDMAIGGIGADGGAAGAVSVDNRQTLATNGDQAMGIAAYSIGGGGGAGGAADVREQTLGQGYAVGANLAIGGSGGSGNTGGGVTVSNESAIETLGFAANGIHALSAGGGGGVAGLGTVGVANGFDYFGYGGYVPSSSLKLTDKTYTANVSVGGSGGGGGHGDAVSVTNAGSIATFGSDARGILAQSIGGGGGLGAIGKNNTDSKVQLNVAVGGGGGAAGDGGAVTVANLAGASILTFGDGAFGIQAQSVGGGGGSAGSASSRSGDKFVNTAIKAVGGYALKSTFYGLKNLFTTLAQTGDGSPARKAKFKFSSSVNMSFGGVGGAAGDGGDVTIGNDATIETYGDVASGILAQSVGGGGGNGGGGDVTAGKLLNFKMAVGGSGGAAGNGGAVSVRQAGTLTTAGAASFGILAQSVGGGGGLGVMGTDGSGWDPVGSFLRSVTGGSSTAAGDGGAVSVTNTGGITTTGAEAHAIVAQSVGAGGGVSIDAQRDPAALLAAAEAIGADDKTALKAAGIDVDARLPALRSYVADRVGLAGASDKTLGGDAARGQGGTVTVEHRGAITTGGAGALGILAQSIGGGGGFLVNGAGNPASISVTLGGANGAAGDGLGVTVSLLDAATITTTGASAHGILAQSIGGGGGYAGRASSLTTGISNGDRSGSGGAVAISVAQGATLRTSGEAAHGIFAQSLGGGGGAGFDLSAGGIFPGDLSGQGSGSGGQVTIDVGGTIAAGGLNAYGILVQSGAQTGAGLIALDDSRRGAIDATVSGHVTGGTGTGAAVRLDGGQQARLTVADGGRLDSPNGRTVIGSYAPDAVFNRGTIVGDVHLGGSDVAGRPDMFENGADGATRAILRTRDGGIVYLGAEGLLRNAATLDIGGRGTLAQTTLTGSFEQTDAGHLIVDVRPMARNGALTSDLLTLSEAGATVKLGGTVQPHLVGGLLPGQFTFLTGGAIESVTATARETTIQSGAVPVSWSIVQTGNSLALSPRADFTNPRGAALTPNQREVAGALQQAWEAGSIAQADVFARFLTVGNRGGYAAALDDIHNKSSLHSLTGRVGDTRAGLRRAMSCPAFTGATMLLQEGQCVWSRFSAERSSMGTTADEEGYRQKAYGIQVGAQKEVAPGWFVGFSGAYTDAEQDTADRLSGSTSDAGDISLAVKRQAGPWLFAMSGNLGYAWQRNSRSIAIGDATARAESRQRVFSAGGRLRVSYQQPLGGWYVRPYADVDVLYTHSPGYSEQGAPGLNLDVRSLNETLLGVGPNLEVGGRVGLGGGCWLRPFATVGGAFFSNDHFTGRASLQGDTALGSFATTSRIPDALAEAGAGVQLWLGHGVELLGEYQGRRGEHFRSHTGTLRLSVRF
ncbi:MAG: autotransporter outer membrane beta-barrel domain-containing protein [Rhizorhabdus sp.]